jgi:hypothetical protein
MELNAAWEYEVEGFSVVSTGPIPEWTLNKEKGFEFPHAFYIFRSGTPRQYGRHLASFALASMEGLESGVAVSISSYNSEDSGLSSKLFHQIKETIAKRFGYSYMVATARLNNFPETVGAAKYGWKLIDDFHNNYSNHDLVFMTKKLA